MRVVERGVVDSGWSVVERRAVDSGWSVVERGVVGEQPAWG